VNQHSVGIDRLQPSTDRVGALLSAFDRFANFQTGQSSARKFALAFADYDPNRFHGRVREQGFDGSPKDGFPRKEAILLGESSTHAFAFAGGDDECGEGHGAGV